MVHAIKLEGFRNPLLCVLCIHYRCKYKYVTLKKFFDLDVKLYFLLIFITSL